MMMVRLLVCKCIDARLKMMTGHYLARSFNSYFVFLVYRFAICKEFLIDRRESLTRTIFWVIAEVDNI